MRAPLAALLAIATASLIAPASAGADRGGEPAAPSEPSESAIVVVSGSALVEGSRVVDGVYVVSGDARIDGTVTGDAWVLSGDATVTGQIEGDLTTLDGRATLLPGARVGGDLIHGDERPRVSPQASVGGRVEEGGLDISIDFPSFPLAAAITLWIVVTLTALVLGLVGVLAFPRAADAVHRQAERRLLLCTVFGISAFIVGPGVAGFAASTLIGLPLAAVILLALLPLGAVAYVSAAWALGRALVRDRGDRLVPFLAGLAILRALALIPLLGILIFFAAVAVGLGLLIGAVAASRQSGEEASAVSA